VVARYRLAAMSYDLVFWKQQAIIEADPRAIYRTLVVHGGTVDGVEPLPVDEFVKGIEAAFPNATCERSGDDQIFWLDQKQQLIFEMYYTPVVVVATMRPLDESVANRIVDVAVSVGAPLYDPQVNERFVLP
jgi:hypothetical protein